MEVDENLVETIASSRIRIEYAVKPGREAVSEVELWFTADRGRTWKRAHLRDEEANPLAFDAPGDGLFGLFLVLRSERGSGSPPSEGAVPHHWVRVDRAAPIVQILGVRPDERFDLNREILIRWSAKDEGFGDRPVALHYRTEQTKAFRLIADSLSAASFYRWTVPNEVGGRLEIKVSARDRAGHRGRQVADRLRIEVGGPILDAAATSGGDLEAGPVAESASGASQGNSQAVDAARRPTTHSAQPSVPQTLKEEQAIEVKRLYDLGTYHRLRGEYAVALARYRDALQMYPGLVAARNDLAGVLYLRGDLAWAEEEYRDVLNRSPEHRSALKGLALVQARRRKYGAAHETLEALLKLQPEDARAWLNLGDVRMLIGDRSRARDAWAKADGSKTATPETRERAAKRLERFFDTGLTVATGG